MTKNTLGLPLEYSTLHKYFDALSCENDDAKNDVIERILKSYNVKSVLDLTCGTGSQVLYLAKRGYMVTGADFSPDLLHTARKKTKQEHLEIEYIDGDMRTLHVGIFDAVITIFNAIGHLTKDDFNCALKNISRNLKQGGLYIFDIFNLQAMTDALVKNLAMDVKKTVNNTHIHHMQYSTLDRENGYLTSYDHYTIQEASGESKTIKNQFTLQIYSALELQELLAENGFETLAQYQINGKPFVENNSLQILTIAKKT